MESAVDILILSNAPGELATWVKPVVQALRQQFGEDRSQVRISVVLSPCANASGQEVAIVQRYPEVDRVQAAAHFYSFLLWGKTAENWDWRSRGVVVFLGGDQFFPVIIGKRLGYRTLVYAEWQARWHRWIDRFGVMRPEVLTQVAPQFAHKFTVVGDLIAEAGSRKPEDARRQAESETPNQSPFASFAAAPLIGLLPGSKPAKLSLGVPLTLAIAEQIQAVRPEVQFVIPVAPTLQLADLVQYADPAQNSTIERLGWAMAELVIPAPPELPYLQTPAGLKILLWTEFPAYDLLEQCTLCLTTIGANTAELGALAVPMLVLMPTQQMDAMRAWDGLPGLLVNLPGLGSTLAKLMNAWAVRRLGLLAWPNIWAQAEIVPELLGPLQPDEVAAQVLELLDYPEKLQVMRENLRRVRGEPGAATKLVALISELLSQQAE